MINKKTAIITGASGFIGKAVVKELSENGYKIYTIVRKQNTIPTICNCIPIFCSLEEISKIAYKIPEEKNSIFFHLAWGGVGEERKNHHLQLNNIQWTLDSLQVAKAIGCTRFVCAGSIMEYEAMAVAYEQGTMPSLGYIYGAGKIAAHIMCKSIAAESGIDLIWANITNAYGEGEYSSRLINSTIRKCINGESPQFTSGTQNYDFVYIDDVARALRLIGENGLPFYKYIIGSGKARPLREFLMEMKQAIAPNLNFRFGDIPFTGVNLPLSYFDCSQTEHDTGFSANMNFRDGCIKTYKWYKSILEKNDKIFYTNMEDDNEQH